MTTLDPRPASGVTVPKAGAPAGHDPLSGQLTCGIHPTAAAEGSSSPQAIMTATPTEVPPAGTTITRPARQMAETNTLPPAGHDPLSGQCLSVTHAGPAAEGTRSPQAMAESITMVVAPAGSKTSHGHQLSDSQLGAAVAAYVPGGHEAFGLHVAVAAGDSFLRAAA